MIVIITGVQTKSKLRRTRTQKLPLTKKVECWKKTKTLSPRSFDIQVMRVSFISFHALLSCQIVTGGFRVAKCWQNVFAVNKAVRSWSGIAPKNNRYRSQNDFTEKNNAISKACESLSLYTTCSPFTVRGSSHILQTLFRLVSIAIFAEKVRSVDISDLKRTCRTICSVVNFNCTPIRCWDGQDCLTNLRVPWNDL